MSRGRVALLALPWAFLPSCGPDRLPREEPPPLIDPFHAWVVAAIDPLEGNDADPVLAVRGIPIRRGDFRRVVDYLRRIGAPNAATRALREAAFLQVLLPRSLHLHRAERKTVEAVLESLDSLRMSASIAEWTARLAPFGTLPVDTEEVASIAPRAASPEIAIALLRLREPGQRVGPVWAREGVFAFELAGPANDPTNLAAPRDVRTGGVFWSRSVDVLPPLPAVMREVLAAGEVRVIDPEFRSVVPERLP